jgi:hypothetical protein
LAHVDVVAQIVGVRLCGPRLSKKKKAWKQFIEKKNEA